VADGETDEMPGGGYPDVLGEPALRLQKEQRRMSG